MRYTAEELERMPTLFIGFADDLKMETDTRRVWLARTSTADGEPFTKKITIEELREGRWVTINEYPG